jgi:hypothetical protein
MVSLMFAILMSFAATALSSRPVAPAGTSYMNQRHFYRSASSMTFCTRSSFVCSAVYPAIR